MYVDWSVELGADDPVLDFPWVLGEESRGEETRGEKAIHYEIASETPLPGKAGTLRYYDLRADPSLVDHLPEAQSSSELRKFLLRMNAAGFPLQSAKCDHWFTREISEEEEIFGAPCKFASYVDLLFTAEESQLSFADHEDYAARLCDLLKGAPEMPASAEIMVRRCFYANHPDHDGYYLTVYVSGFGETEAQSRQRWSIALTLVQHALVQSVKSLNL
jgi:hypothetical protein